MDRKFQKYLLKYQFLEMELEDTTEFVESKSTDWSKLFGKYQPKEKEVWINEETGEVNSKPESKNTTKPIVHSSVKSAYRTISKHLHPDKGGDELEFDKAKKYYEANNVLGLIQLANQHSITIDKNNIPEEVLEEACKVVQTQIGDKRNTILWKYFNGDKSAKLEVVAQLEQMFNVEINKEELDLT